MFKIVYHPKVFKEDIKKLSLSIRRRIKDVIETRLMIDPLLYSKPLRRSLAGYRKCRIGDYGIILKIKGQKVIILIIAHRSWVYKVGRK